VFDRAGGWDPQPAGPGFGAGLNGGGMNSGGLNGSDGNGAEWNGAGVNNGAGWNSAGWNSAGWNGAGWNGAGASGAGWNRVAAGPAEAVAPSAISLGLTHRIYPDGRAVAVICGELDAATADQAFEYVRQVIDRSRGPVRVDLAGLTFCDARGLRTLVGAAVHARKAGRKLSLVGPRPAIIKIMRITGVDANFPELRQPDARVT